MSGTNIFSQRYIDFVNKHRSANYAEMSSADVDAFLQEANEIKTEYNNFELVVKANANSLYGSSGNQYFSFYCPRLAGDITMTGKHFTVLIDRAINNYFTKWNEDPSNLKRIQEFYPNVVSIKPFHYVKDTIDDLCVYGDTDSRYVRLDSIYKLLVLEDGSTMKLPESDKELADFAVFMNEHYFAPIVKNSIEEDCKFRNARLGYMKMGHEVTSRRSVFIMKKKYIMNSIWVDGRLLDKPKLKYRGVELRRGSVSESAKKILELLVTKYIQLNYDLSAMVKECHKVFKYIKTKRDVNMIYQISSVSGLSSITKDKDGRYVSDKNHIQMQLACSWLNFIHQNKLEDRYQPAFEGQKMQFYYCAEGSPYKVIAVPDDVDMSTIQNLPEPDWNKMIIQSIIKPFYRYISDKKDVTDKDIEYFLIGVQQINF